MRREQAGRTPVVARQRLTFVLEREHRLPRREVREWHVGGVSVVAMCEQNGVGAPRPASARMSSTTTPSHAVLSFDHEVTQWMSRIILVRGSALNSDQLHALTGRGPTFSVKVQFAASIRGVGPAVSTGKLSTRCCPGGIRSDSSDPDWRPAKPRVTMADFLRRRVKRASSRTTR